MRTGKGGMGEEGEEVLGSGFWVLSSELGVGSWELAGKAERRVLSWKARREKF